MPVVVLRFSLLAVDTIASRAEPEKEIKRFELKESALRIMKHVS